MPVDTKTIAVIFALAAVLVIVLYILFKPKKSKTDKDLENKVKDLKDAQNRVNQNLGIVIPSVEGKCRPETFPEYTAANNSFGEALERLKKAYTTEKQTLITADVKTLCENALKSADDFIKYINSLKTCASFCEGKGTATLVEPRVCECKTGYTNPKPVDGFIVCAETKASADMRRIVNDYQPSEDKLLTYFQNPLPTRSSPGCIAWADKQTPKKDPNLDC